MRTTLDQEEILFSILNNSTELKATISGGIYRETRPTNSGVEDVVIVSLPILPGSIQFGTANVNIHVPDIKAIGRDYFEKDSARLKQLTKIIEPLLEETYGDDYLLYISLQQTFEEPEIQQHYVNLRIDFEFHNTN